MRHVYVDFLSRAYRMHMVHGLLEVDVTLPRQLIREYKAQTGEKLSFTAFILHCLGRAVDRHREMHAYRNWRNQLVLFDEVDITTMIEIDVGDRRLPISHIVRATNRRTVRQIHDEIRALQTERQAARRNPFAWQVKVYRWIPRFLRRWAIGWLFRSPQQVKARFGTVGLTAVGMFGQGGGWALTVPSHTLGVAVGGIAWQPRLVDGQLENREYLNLTLSFDHDIVDGGPAARFANDLKTLMEEGYGLVEQQESSLT
jgi:pyruvate/2-oxoglutarate dehydrogenase complex dihydrolipoamide acyltransferase (E2) component